MEKKAEQVSHARNSTEIVVLLDDLLFEILLRLPVKSILRFQLVSKHWLSLINDPRFCHRHTSSTPSLGPIGLFLPFDCGHERVNECDGYVPLSPEGSRNPSFGELNFVQDPLGITIEDSCDGLLLCRTKTNKKSYVYNPTTRKFSMVPDLEERVGVLKSFTMTCLVFDPIVSPHYYLICIRRLTSDKYMYQPEIYSSENGSWRVCGEPFFCYYSTNRAVYWNRSVHWWASLVHLDSTCDILYFNIDQHLFGKMVAPFVQWQNVFDFYMVKSGGRFQVVEHTDVFHCVVHELKVDYSEWFIKYRFNLSHLLDIYPSIEMNDEIYYCNVLSLVHRGDKEDDPLLVLEVPGLVIRYDISSKAVETLSEFDQHPVNQQEEFRYSTYRAFGYFESLCFV